jgi:hypothetical protein
VHKEHCGAAEDSPRKRRQSGERQGWLEVASCCHSRRACTSLVIIVLLHPRRRHEIREMKRDRGYEG